MLPIHLPFSQPLSPSDDEQKFSRKTLTQNFMGGEFHPAGFLVNSAAQQLVQGAGSWQLRTGRGQIKCWTEIIGREA